MIAYLVGIELRRRWRSLTLITAVVAVVVATVVSSLAGADRSGSAFDRYLEEVDGPDAMAFGDGRDVLRDLEAVEAALDIELIAAFPQTDAEDFYPLVVGLGGRIPYERARLPVVEGRFPDRAAPLEIALSERTATRLGMDIGETLTLATLSPDAAARLNEDGTFDPDGPEIPLEVVGIVRDAGDIGARLDDITITYLTPAFRDAYPADVVGVLDEGTYVFLREGHSFAELTAATRGADVELDTSFFLASDAIAPTTGTIAAALRLFAAVAALAGVIAIVQAVARIQQAASEDDRTLGALGTTRRERWARLAVPGGMVVVAGSAMGMAVAVPASALFPIGLARRAEPDPGVHLDGPTVLVGGVAAAVVLTMLVGALAAWRVRNVNPGTASVARVSRLGQWAADLGAPAPGVTGLSLAAGTSGRPSPIALGGTLLSVLGVLAALVFSASIDRLRADPSLYGWGWDAVIEGEDLSSLGATPKASLGLLEDEDIVALGDLYTQLPVTLDGEPQFAMAVAPERGTLEPVMVRGTAPVGPDEIAVGRDSLHRIGAQVGDTISVSTGGDPTAMRITGVVALPVPEDGGSSASGAYLGLASLEPLAVEAQCSSSDSCTRTIAVDLAPGVDPHAWAERFGDRDDINVALPAPPAEVDRLAAVEDLPRYLAGFLALLAATAVSFATATTVRQRRRDLAVLRVLGMTGRHVRTVVTVLVLAVTGAGAVLGGALGLVIGRQVWRAVVVSVSLPFSPSLPVGAALLVPIAAVLLAQLVASTSRRSAGRVPAALVLRTE